MTLLILVLAWASVALAAAVMMITGDIPQVVYKPGVRSLSAIVRHPLIAAGAIFAPWLAALLLHLLVTPVQPAVLIVTGIATVFFYISGVVMVPRR